VTSQPSNNSCDRRDEQCKGNIPEHPRSSPQSRLPHRGRASSRSKTCTAQLTAAILPDFQESKWLTFRSPCHFVQNIEPKREQP
jgi:hypothetical protein